MNQLPRLRVRSLARHVRKNGFAPTLGCVRSKDYDKTTSRTSVARDPVALISTPGSRPGARESSGRREDGASG